MRLIEKIIGKLAPYTCLGCDIEGGLMCNLCLGLFPDLPERCYRCRDMSPANLTCLNCRRASPIVRAVAVTEYEGPAKTLVWRLKFTGSTSAAVLMAGCMQSLLASLSEDAIIVPVPTAPSRVRSRGYDQAKLLARELAVIQRRPLANALSRLSNVQQVGAGRAQRLGQLEHAFRVTKKVTGRHIILVDDISTTGATLESAAKTLHHSGAVHIEAITFAQV